MRSSSSSAIASDEVAAGTGRVADPGDAARRGEPEVVDQPAVGADRLRADARGGGDDVAGAQLGDVAAGGVDERAAGSRSA